MKTKSLFLAAALSVSSFSLAAMELANVKLSESIEVNDQELVLNGAGIRNKFFMDLYVAALYTSEKGNKAEPMIEGDKPMAIRLNITSGMITSERLVDAMNEGFDAATGGDTSAMEATIEEFMTHFEAPTNNGDQLTFFSIPGQGLVVNKNNELLTTVECEEFRKLVMKVWLGDKPSDRRLKRAMLKG
ncbi:chalcone isomerase family protein [Ferrimonas pelagia]|uniref:Chalcone isomerase family protein n=1 Tax=Ferrimonas pelagia TaxID=1177826 RepID=A0ABP9EZD9_9GAMM